MGTIGAAAAAGMHRLTWASVSLPPEVLNRRGEAARERRCGTADPHDQRRGRGVDGASRLYGCQAEAPSLLGRTLQPEAHPFGARLSQPDGVRGNLVCQPESNRCTLFVTNVSRMRGAAQCWPEPRTRAVRIPGTVPPLPRKAGGERPSRGGGHYHPGPGTGAERPAASDHLPRNRFHGIPLAPGIQAALQGCCGKAQLV